MSSLRLIQIVTPTGSSTVIDVAKYPNTVFAAAYSSEHSQENLIQFKTDYPMDVIQLVLNVIKGSTTLYRYDATDAIYIEIVKEFYPEYEPSDDYDLSDSEDEYDDYDPYEIPKKKGPNHQKPSVDDDEKDDILYDAIERAERGCPDYFSDV